jgi:electron transfer flavoprotein beta subunit
MPTIVACYKWVVDEADIRIGDDLSVDTSRAQNKISDFDRSAIEAAMRISAETGDDVATLSYGTPAVSKSMKDALSRGPGQGYWIGIDAASESDGRATAKALAAGTRAIGDVSLVVCAEGASDTYARQVGPRLGAYLDWPIVTSVVDMKVEGTAITATRKLENVTQSVEVEMPAVICVLPEGFEPKIPGLKAIMGAGKKPQTELSANEFGIDPSPVSQRGIPKGFAMARKNLLIAEDDMAVAAKELADAMRKEGVL